MFCFRLDMAVDGHRNTVTECEVVVDGSAHNPYGNMFRAVETPLTTELGAQRRVRRTARALARLACGDGGPLRRSAATFPGQMRIRCWRLRYVFYSVFFFFILSIFGWLVLKCTESLAREVTHRKTSTCWFLPTHRSWVLHELAPARLRLPWQHPLLRRYP